MPASLPEHDLRPHLERRHWWVFALALAAVGLLYALTIPANHTEAEDGFSYAYDVRERPCYELFHIQHLLYLPLMRLIYTAGHFPDAFNFMVGFDVLCGIVTLGLLFLWLERGMRIGRTANVFACLFLAFSYGFWRYAVEAEVYTPALVLMVWLAGRMFRRGQPLPSDGHRPGKVGDALLGTAAMLIHAPLATPLAVVAVPFYLLITRRFQTFMVYGAVATALVTGVYFTAFRIEKAHRPPDMVAANFGTYLAGAGNGVPVEAHWNGFPKAAVGLGVNVVSSNYLFAIPKAAAKLNAAFPTHNFTEEAFMAQEFSRTLAHLGLALTGVLLGLTGFAAVFRLEWSRPRLRAMSCPEVYAVFLWLAGYSALAFVTDPEDPEHWICGLLPVAAVTGVLVHFLYRELVTARLPWIFAGVLLTQNLVGGFIIIHHPDSDFNIHKGAWIMAHAHKGDVVFTRDNEVFSRYLRYYSPATIVNCGVDDSIHTRAKLNTRAAAGGARFLFMDVVEPPGYIRRGIPTMYDDLAGLRQELLPTLAPTGADDVKQLP